MSSAADLLQNLSAKTSVCFGTRAPIQLRQGSSVSPCNGIVAVFSCQQDNNESPYLLILLNNGNCSFQGRIRPSEATKVVWKNHVSSSTTSEANNHESNDVSNETKIKILSSFLLEDIDRIGVSYDYTTSDDNDDKQQVKLVIRQQMSTTDMTRFLWSSVLEPLNDNTNLSFARILGTIVNRNNEEIQALQTLQGNTRVDLLNWKDTAEKLDRDWQSEKDGLLNNFLKLYKKAHEQLGESRQEVSSLKRELAEARAMAAAASNNAKKRSRSPPPAYAALPDDDDAEQFEPDMVEMLAMGQKTSVSKKKRTGGKASKSPDMLMRKNPHTGAKEVWDTDTLIREMAQEEEAAAAAAATTTTSKRDSTESAGSKGNKKKDSTETNTNGKKDVVMEDATARNKNAKEDASYDPMAVASALFASKENKKGNSGDSTKPPSAKRSKKKADPKDEMDDIMAAASKHFGTEV